MRMRCPPNGFCSSSHSNLQLHVKQRVDPFPDACLHLAATGFGAAPLRAVVASTLVEPVPFRTLLVDFPPTFAFVLLPRVREEGGRNK